MYVMIYKYHLVINNSDILYLPENWVAVAACYIRVEKDVSYADACLWTDLTYRDSS